MRSLPSLTHRRYVANQIATAWDRVALETSLFFCRDPLEKARMKDAGASRWRIVLETLAFRAVERPLVSIVVAVCNRYWSTLACLDAIKSAPGGPDFEVIVVDDRSSDKTARILSKVPGLLTLRNDRKLGVSDSFNRGALEAKGEYLVFLDQDALVEPGWLGSLAQTFRDFPDTGLAGPKLLRPDGRLKQAGSSLWRDASAWAYGESDDAGHPWYNFAREVDYCAGCFMVPRELFLELGGFDTKQGDAFADADLAFRIRQQGHKVIYQSVSRVVQHDRPSSRDRASSSRQKQDQAHLERFRKRWRERLETHPDPSPGLVRLVRPQSDRQSDLGKVLVIDHRIPSPDRDSGSFRMMEIIRGIKRRGHHVTLLPDNMEVFSPYLENLEQEGVEVIHRPYYDSVEEYLAHHGREQNLVIISRADVASRHMAVVRRHAPQARIIFDTVDLHFMREERQARLGDCPKARELAECRKVEELGLARMADLTLVVSPVEKSIIDQECDHQIDVRILSNIHPVIARELPGYEARRNIIFIGGFDHAPNADAVLYFAREIFPRIHERIPEAVFQVIGPYPTEEISRLASKSIHILGFVPDVAPLFDQARVSVAPLRFGAGVKGKVNQSMSFGVPTVVTSVASEGMYLTHGVNVMIADPPESFADAVVELWTNPELWRQVSQNGMENLVNHFSVEAAARTIDELLAWAGLCTSRVS